MSIEIDKTKQIDRRKENIPQITQSKSLCKDNSQSVTFSNKDRIKTEQNQVKCHSAISSNSLFNNCRK